MIWEKVFAIILILISMSVSDAKYINSDDILMPWGHLMVEQYRGSSTPSYLDLSGQSMLVGGIDMEINLPVYRKYLYVGAGVYAQGNDYQVCQQTGKFWIGSQLTTNFGIIFHHRSSHNFDHEMTNRVPFTTLDSVQLKWTFGKEPN
jgi:hypothetical protein